jgi:flavin reductase (DIM6/NTAB) family NADH-FMN oxidoreductase RutF
MRLSREDVLAFEKRYRATFFNSLSGFRSIHLCGTQNKAGIANLCVLNSVFHVGSAPPLLGLMLRPEGARQHTLQNIRETGWYTLNQMPSALAAQVHQTAARYEPDQDEFTEVGLTKQFDDNCPAPFVAESPIRYSLKLEEEHQVKANGIFILVGAVQHMEVANADLIGEDGYVDLSKADVLAANGLDAYHQVKPVARFAYPKAGKPTAKL